MADTDGAIVIEGAGIEVYRRLAIVHALALEVNTGLTHSRGSVRQLANSLSGSTARTKRASLAAYVAWLKSEMPDWQPSSSVTRALS